MDRKSTLHDFAAGEIGRGPGVPSSLTNQPPFRPVGRAAHVQTHDRRLQDLHRHRRRRRTQFAVRLRLPFHCVECFNSSIWDFQAGHEYTQKLEDKIVDDLKAPWIQGITFLGGEPMLNTPVLLPLARRIRGEFGHDKDIWCWTGYTWEELMRPGETPDKLELLQLIDILVDGRYLKDQHDSLLQFRGSRNQRILDVPRSLAAGRPVVWAKLHDQERDIPEMYLKDREAGEGAQAS